MIAAAVEVEATYKDLPPNEYTITVEIEGEGTASASANSATAGTIITLTQTASTGWEFSNWTVLEGGVTIAANNTFTMPANAVKVKAVFTEVVQTYTVIVVNGDGDGDYAAGDIVSITANAAPIGKVFDKWTTAAAITFVDINNANTTFVMIAQDVEVTATYKDLPANEYLITVEIEGTGSASASANSAEADALITLTATETTTGWTFSRWQVVEGDVVLSSTTELEVTFAMPAEDVIVKAIFEYNDGINNISQTSALIAWTHDGILHVSGLVEGNIWSVYSVSGALVYQAKATSEQAEVVLQKGSKGVYIIRSGEKIVKLIIK
jgi:carbon monoxide dehydrogenase subunit G